MASPFSLFRKNQKALMVVLVGLSMFAFIIMGNGDPNQEGSGMVTALMMICLVGGIGWGLGYKQGKGQDWAITGALFGAVLVAGFWWFGGGTPYVQTGAGNLSRREVDDLVNRRRTANQFVERAFQTKNPFPRDLPLDLAGIDPRFRDQLLGQIRGGWYQQLNQHLFGFNSQNRDAPDDVVLGFLLAKEAEDLGIEVSDKAVTEYIYGITGGEKLTKNEMTRIVREMRITEGDLYEALRPEIRNQMAYELLRPRTYTTPQEYWEYYKRLTVSQSLATTAVPVDAFVDETAEPTDQELESLFDAYKEFFPNQKGPGEPGFLQDPKVRLAYLAIDHDTIRKSIPEPTDSEIAAYYEENKTIYRNRTIEDLGTPFDEPRGPSLPLPTDPKPEDGDPQDGDPKDGEATDPQPTDPETSDPESTEPENTDPQPTDPQPEPDPTDPQPEPAEPDPGQDTSEGEDTSSIDVPDATLLSVSDDTAANDDATPDDNADESQGSDDAPADDPQPKSDEDGSTDPQPEDPADPKPADPESADPESTDSTPPDDLPTGEKPGNAESGEEKPPEYKPLEEVRDEIRDALIKQRTDARIASLMEKAGSEMAEIGVKFSSTSLDGKSGPDGEVSAEKPLTIRSVNETMVAKAREWGVDYVVLPLQTQAELRASGEAIVNAQTLTDGETDGQPVLGELFDGSDFLLSPIQAGQPFGDARYIVWKLADVPTHLPMLEVKTMQPSAKLADIAEELGFDDDDRQKLFPRAGEITRIGDYFQAHFDDGAVKKGSSINVGQFQLTAAEVADGRATSLQLTEPGIRDQVVKAWRILQARPKAEARAKELAKMAEEKPSTSMAVVYSDETVTGKEDGQELEVRITPEFTWLTTSSAPSRGLQPRQTRPMLSQVTPIDGAGEDFMKTVFEELDNGEMGVVPNFAKTVYYVVKVRERSPLNPLEGETHRQEFMSVIKEDGTPGTSGAYPILENDEYSLVLQNWGRAIQAKYAVEWNRDR